MSSLGKFLLHAISLAIGCTIGTLIATDVRAAFAGPLTIGGVAACFFLALCIYVAGALGIGWIAHRIRHGRTMRGDA